jgi:hypothetical protein
MRGLVLWLPRYSIPSLGTRPSHTRPLSPYTYAAS